MHDYYKPYTVGLPWTTFLDLIGWEFFFRGWILFGYARKFGAEALWLHAVPFALAHIGKPEVETLSTIFGGFAFGWIAYRTKSFVWPFLSLNCTHNSKRGRDMFAEHLLVGHCVIHVQ